MKKIYVLSLVLFFSTGAFGQAKKAVSDDQKNIRVISGRNGSTSELLPIPVAAASNVRSAKIGLKYFGVKDESNISFVLILKGAQPFYKNGERYGVQLFADDVPTTKNRFRGIDPVGKNGGEEVFRMHISTEELAWLAGAEKISIGIFDVETEQLRETLELTPAAFGQVKKFARSVYLINSSER